MNLAVIGAGSTYTPELIDGIALENQDLGFKEIRLYDPDPARLEILAQFSKRLLSRRGADAALISTRDLRSALTGSDFVVSQIRVGGQAARQSDTLLGLRHGLIGQETVGCGGFACALRHIPASIAIAREMEKICPKAVLVNFTNPAGMVTEALCRATKIRTVGICNVFRVMRKDLADYYKVRLESVDLEYFGLNHLSWAVKIRIEGMDRTSDALERCAWFHVERYRFPPHLLETLQVLPSPYLRYYYMTPEILAEMKIAAKTRAQEVMELEAALLARYRDPELSEKPPELLRRGGIHYGQVAVAAVKALVGSKPSRQILNLPNGKVFSWLPEEAVIEFPWMVSRSGIVPEKPPPVPGILKSLMIQVKTYEQLTIQAALTGDRKAAYQALLANPLVGSAGKAQAILDDLALL